MKLSLEWLNLYVDLSAQSIESISHALTMIGFEVEEISTVGLAPMEHVVVGEILSFEQHPNADRLSLCQVKVDEGEPRFIICGAKNFKQGDRIIAALPGAVLPGDLKIKKAKLRGVASEGMMCSERELGIGEDHDGIAILENRPEIGTPVNALYPKSDTVFNVEVTPNRPDVLSHLGMARELAAWFKTELQLPKTKAQPEDATSNRLVKSVTLVDTATCPLYLGFSVKGVKIAASPDWLQRRLRSIGLRPINNVVDITNFVLHETGQPLHAFDANKILGEQIIVRPATENEKITTLDEKERSLDSSMLVIADAERPLVVAGVMGSLDAEVDDDTVDLFLEAAYFYPTAIRKTSKELGLSTDSSYRYERGVDPLGSEYAALRCLDLILEIAGGKLVGKPIKEGEAPFERKEILLKPDFVRRRLGFRVSDEDIIRFLERLELKISDDIDSEGLPVLLVSVPSWRSDLYRSVDLVEEVIRMYGADRIPEGEVNARGLLAEDNPSVLYERKSAEFLVGRSFQEAVHYTLRSSQEFSRWFGNDDQVVAKVGNPLAQDASHLRASLIPGLLDCVALNQSRKNDPRRLFETGRVFHPEGEKFGEMVSVGFVMLNSTEASWKEREPLDFYSASAALLPLVRNAGIKLSLADLRPLENAAWQTGQSAEAGSLKDGWIANVGLLDLAMTREWDIEGQVYAGSFKIYPEKLKAGVSRTHFKSFSLQPPAIRDLALIVDQTEASGKVERGVKELARKTVGEGFFLENARIFDLYEGEGLEAGKKSIAFQLVYRSEDRTLNDKEVNAAFEALQRSLEDQTGYSIRR